MNRRLSVARRAAIALLPCLAGCVALGSPAAPVRWFDPLASSLSAAPPVGTAAADTVIGGPVVRVVAADHLGQEFEVRIAEHEVAFDGDHRWLLPPRDLVAEALRRAGARGDDGTGTALVHVDAFEFDRVATPFALVRLRLHGASAAGADPVVEVRVPARDATPEALVQAMARALPQAAAEVVSRLSTGRADGGD